VNLTSLRLSGHQIGEIPSEFGTFLLVWLIVLLSMVNLQRLVLSRNQIAVIPAQFKADNCAEVSVIPAVLYIFHLLMKVRHSIITDS